MLVNAANTLDSGSKKKESRAGNRKRTNITKKDKREN